MRFAECWTWKLNWPLSYLTETTPGLDIFLKNSISIFETIDTFHRLCPCNFCTRSGTFIVSFTWTLKEQQMNGGLRITAIWILGRLEINSDVKTWKRPNVSFWTRPSDLCPVGASFGWTTKQQVVQQQQQRELIFFFLFGCIWKVPELKSNGKIKMEENCVDHREQRPPNWREAPNFFLFCEQVSPIAVGRFHPLLPSTLWLLFHHPLFDSASAFSFF